eukprot:scaffold116_cov233-Pinguiococcus_pyrenoidosus.AAC.9
MYSGGVRVLASVSRRSQVARRALPSRDNYIKADVSASGVAAFWVTWAASSFELWERAESRTLDSSGEFLCF